MPRTYIEEEHFIVTSEHEESPFPFPTEISNESISEWLRLVFNSHLRDTFESIDVLNCEVDIVWEDHINVDFNLQIKYTNPGGKEILANKGSSAIEVSTELVKFEGVWYVNSVDLQTDKIRQWNVTNLQNSMVRLTGFQLLNKLLFGFHQEFFKNSPLYHEVYPGVRDGIESVLIVGLAGSGKSYLQYELEEQGYISIADESHYRYPELTGVRRGIDSKNHLDFKRVTVQEFPLYLQERINYELNVNGSMRELLNRLRMQCNINNTENKLAKALGAPVVRNGSILQKLISSLAYYNFTPFGEYVIQSADEVEEKISELENPTDEQIDSILKFVESIHLDRILDRILKASGNPKALIIMGMESCREDIELHLAGDTDRRFTALKYEPWLKLWYRVIEIVLEHKLKGQVEVIRYDYINRETKSHLLDITKKILNLSSHRIDSEFLIKELVKDQYLFIQLGKLQQEKLQEIFLNLHQNGSLFEFIQLLNKLLDSYKLPTINLNENSFPISDLIDLRFQLLNNLILNLKKYNESVDTLEA